MGIKKEDSSIKKELKIENEDKNDEIKQPSQEKCEEEKKTETHEDVAQLKLELEQQKDLLLRTAAEYKNFRTRSEKEKAAIYNDGIADAVLKLLPIADSLELALGASENAPDDYKKGLEMIKNQVTASFESLSVKSFCESGDEFDPNIHNAVSHIDDENITENTVIEVFQKGYLLKEKVIRPAMVKVAN